jgi:uncharacterized membrane protein YeaQ/YmgE (transglycosylase-associated protein family)
MLHIIWYIIIGFIAGGIAGKIVPHAHLGFWGLTILGIIGSIVGGFVTRLFSKPAEGRPFHPAGLITSIIFSIIILIIAGRFF